MRSCRHTRRAGRRKFMVRGCGVFAACLAAPWWHLVTGCSADPAAEPAGPLTLSLAELPLDRRMRFEHGDRAVEVIRTVDGVSARSLLCPHQGCNVRWVEADQLYFCPCHEGRFDAAGRPVYGPPREPLRELPVTLTETEAIIGG